MKKKISVLLVLLLTFTCMSCLAEVVPLAESTDRFDMTLALPEGASLSINDEYDTTTFANAVMPDVAEVMITIGPGEEYGEQSLAELSDEEVQLLVENTIEDFDNPTSEINTTPSGNKYILVRQEGEYAMATIFTLYRGYFVQLTQFHDDLSPLTDKDTAFLMDILYGIEFVDAAQ